MQSTTNTEEDETFLLNAKQGEQLKCRGDMEGHKKQHAITDKLHIIRNINMIQNGQQQTIKNIL